MTYEEVVNFLYAQLPVFHREGKKAFKPGLGNIQELAAKIGNPQQHFKCLHIAGTNGKGSSSHFMASILQEAGFRVGLYTSPHLKSFTERIKVNGQEVSHDWVVDFFTKHRALIAEIKPSFFEWTVLMAFAFFKEQGVDYAVIETGLGGRLDSTNIIEPIATYITNIGYDHQDILGETLPEIATEKAGIIKSQIPILISERQEEVEEVFKSTAQACDAFLNFADELVQISAVEQKGIELHLVAKTELWGDLKIESPYAGTYQVQNLRGVIAWCTQLSKRRVLQLSAQVIQHGIKLTRQNTSLRGRWEVIDQDPWVVADTAHNAAGISEVLGQVNQMEIHQLHIILGMVADKDVDRVLGLFPKDAQYYFTQASNPRAIAAVELQKKAMDFGLRGQLYADVNLALQAARETNADFILITGSTYMVAELAD
jgi:dihydrofolate synthase / folylpolyglutamate synthase